MRNYYKAWLPVVGWMVLIFLLSTSLGSAEHTSLIIEPLMRWLNPHITQEALDRVHFYTRKTAHFTEYAVLALLALRALGFSKRAIPARYWQLAGWAWLITAVYAATDEYHQSFVPGRTSSPIDVLIDSSGGLAALIVVTLWRKYRERPASGQSDRSI